MFEGDLLCHYSLKRSTKTACFGRYAPIDWPEKQKVTLTIDNAGEANVESHFTITAERWETFCAALDAPAKDLPALRKLLTEKSILDGNN